MQQMFKQVELKNMEVQRYKTAAEVAKVKSVNLLRVKLIICIKSKELEINPCHPRFFVLVKRDIFG